MVTIGAAFVVLGCGAGGEGPDPSTIGEILEGVASAIPSVDPNAPTLGDAPGPLPGTITGSLTGTFASTVGDEMSGETLNFDLTVALKLRQDDTDPRAYQDAGSTWSFEGHEHEWQYDTTNLCPLQHDDRWDYAGSGSFVSEYGASTSWIHGTIFSDNNGWRLDLNGELIDIPGNHTYTEPGVLPPDNDRLPPHLRLKCETLTSTPSRTESIGVSAKWLTETTFEVSTPCNEFALCITGTMRGAP